jgi:hypothetical protein
MKNISLFVLFVSFSLTCFSQKTPSYIVKKAKAASEYLSNELQFNEQQKSDLYSIFLEKYETTRRKIQGKNLSKEDKQVIYRNSFITTKQALSEKFSNKEVNTINKLHREWQKQYNKK